LPEWADAEGFYITGYVLKPISIGGCGDAEIYGSLEMAEHIKKIK